MLRLKMTKRMKRGKESPVDLLTSNLRGEIDDKKISLKNYRGGEGQNEKSTTSTTWDFMCSEPLD